MIGLILAATVAQANPASGTFTVDTGTTIDCTKTPDACKSWFSQSWTSPYSGSFTVWKPEPVHLPAAFLRNPRAFCDAIIAGIFARGGQVNGAITINTAEGTLVCSDTAPPKLESTK